MQKLSAKQTCMNSVLSHVFFKTSFIPTFLSTDGPDVWIKLFY